MSKTRKKKRAPKRVLALPDLEQSKTARGIASMITVAVPYLKRAADGGVIVFTTHNGSATSEPCHKKLSSAWPRACTVGCPRRISNVISCLVRNSFRILRISDSFSGVAFWRKENRSGKVGAPPDESPLGDKGGTISSAAALASLSVADYTDMWIPSSRI
jgi:hypothetical protein